MDKPHRWVSVGLLLRFWDHGEACLRLYRDFVGVDNDPIKITLSRNRLVTIKPSSLQYERTELDRQITNNYARMRKWTPELLKP